MYYDALLHLCEMGTGLFMPALLTFALPVQLIIRKWEGRKGMASFIYLFF